MRPLESCFLFKSLYLQIIKQIIKDKTIITIWYIYSDFIYSIKAHVGLNSSDISNAKTVKKSKITAIFSDYGNIPSTHLILFDIEKTLTFKTSHMSKPGTNQKEKLLKFSRVLFYIFIEKWNVWLKEMKSETISYNIFHTLDYTFFYWCISLNVQQLCSGTCIVQSK